MNLDELKLVLDALKGVADGAIYVTIVYFVLNFLGPLLKYSIVGVAIYKCIQLFTTLFIVEKASDNDSE